MTRPIIIFLLTALIPLSASAQNNANDISRKYKSYTTSHSISLEDFIKDLTTEANINKNDFQLDHTFESEQAYEHLKYKQYYQGLEVIGANYHIHLKEEKVIYSNGQLHPNIIYQNTKPSITIENAQQLIAKNLSAKNENDYFFLTEDSSNNIEVESSKLVIVDELYPKLSGNYTQAYLMSINIANPYDRQIILLDAHNGRVIHKQSIVCNIAIEGKGKTRQYGEQSFIVDSISPNQFKLYDPIRNITTYSAFTGENLPYYDDDNYWDQTNDNKDEIALDAHFCTSKFYDMMNNLFGWKGLNGSGLGMNPVVHVNGGRAYLNAFWNGQNAYFGNGDCHHNPLTVMSVIGHEFMHGITDYTSDLIYANESGAINESMSDIFGKSLEYLYDNSRFSWDLGPEFANSQYSSFFRSMVNPNAYEDPALYRGEFWDYNNAVHTNSGVFNHWFYLMVEGKNGVNENQITYIVQPMPIEQVLQVVFLTQRAYLTPSSTYPELHLLTLQATKELYGENSPMMNSVTEAWKAVGLPYEDEEEVYDLEPLVLDLESLTCHTDFDYDINYQILNIGTKSALQGDTLFVKFAMTGAFDTIIEIVLLKDLYSGEKLSFSLPKFFNVNETKTYFFRCEILNEDDITDNNYDFGYFRNFTESEPLLILSSTGLKFIECFSDFAEGYHTLSNKSCSTIPTGTIYKIKVRSNDVVVYEDQFILDGDLFPGASRYIPYTIDELDLTEEITTELITSGAIKNEGTRNKTNLSKLKTLQESYFNGFSDLSITGELITYNFTKKSLIEYNLEPVLAAYGATQGETRVPCPIITDNLDEVTFGQSGISGCLDLTSMSRPNLSFDLVQFRYNSTNYPELEKNAALVRVSYSGESSTFSELISNQQEAIIVNKSYELPSNFKGKFEIEFFAHRSPKDNPSPFDYDANLIDNLTISDVTNVKEELNSALKLLPNPARNQLTIVADDILADIRILSCSGVTKTYSIESGQTIDITDLLPGMYIVSVKTLAGKVSNKKFVKI